MLTLFNQQPTTNHEPLMDLQTLHDTVGALADLVVIFELSMIAIISLLSVAGIAKVQVDFDFNSGRDQD
jgi:hypothetical protein